MKQVPLYEQIYQSILSDIENKVYQPGEKLPSDKELSDLYHVSRITSKKAMSMLAEEDRIVRLPGKGSFVAQTQKAFPERPEAGKGKKLIGVILDAFSPSFACRILRSIQSSCEENGYNMVLRCSEGSLKKETCAIKELVDLGVCGFVIMCVHDENYNERILQLVLEHFPIVTIDRKLKGISVSFVGTDNVSAARELTGRLLDKGYRKISFVRPKAHETTTLMDRQQGFVTAFLDHGMIADESLWITDLLSTLPRMVKDEYLEKDIELVDRFLEEHPDVEAFMATEYELAKILRHCLIRKGMYKADAVACFDGLEDFSGEAEFTHVVQGEVEIGQKCMELLFKAIRGEGKPTTVMVPYKIVERDENNWR